MKYRHLALLIVAGALLAAGPLPAGEIYRYIDADGNVTYVDRPTGAETEERLAIVSRSSGTSRAQAPSDSPQRDGATESAADGDSAPPSKKSRAEIRAAERERNQQCQTYREQMATIESARRLYREDESGERVYLEENEIQEARDRVQALIQEFCG